MAHNIHYSEQTEKHSFFSVKEKAWHGIGTIINDYPTSSEAIKYAGLDYTVEKRPLFTYDNENSISNPETEILIPEIKVPDFYANVRTDTEEVLGVVGKDYNIIQNVDAFGFFDSIVGGKEGILYETAGALGKGERIFITAKLPDYIRVGRDDLIENYLFLTTSHDGFGSITAAFTPVRIVCNNTLNAALKGAVNNIKIRHTSSAVDRLKQAHKLLGISHKLSYELEEVFNQWSKIRITDNNVKRLIQMAMAPSKEVLQNLQSGKEEELSSSFNNIVSSVIEYAFTNPTQQEAITRGTLYGAYNAVTGYFQNVRNFKDEESKLKSLMFGTGLQRSQIAFNLCEEFAKYGIYALN
jgi:phage/plasmid-like protein (TIGR03299 family)